MSPVRLIRLNVLKTSHGEFQEKMEIIISTIHAHFYHSRSTCSFEKTRVASGNLHLNIVFAQKFQAG